MVMKYSYYDNHDEKVVLEYEATNMTEADKIFKEITGCDYYKIAYLIRHTEMNKDK